MSVNFIRSLRYADAKKDAGAVKTSPVTRKLFGLVQHYAQEFKGITHLPAFETELSFEEIQETLGITQADELKEGLETLYKNGIVSKTMPGDGSGRVEYDFGCRDWRIYGLDRKFGKSIPFEKYMKQIEKYLD